MTNATCREADCTEPVHVRKRQLCRRHYAAAWYRGFSESEQDAIPVTGRLHSITASDTTAMTGTCTACGPGIRVVIRHGRPICWLGERRSSTKHRHGLSYPEIDALLEATAGRCQVCGDQFASDNPYCLDHDHSCCPGARGCPKCVRGLLCRRCNVAIGMLRDDANLADRAAQYLREIESRNCLLLNSIAKTSI